MAAAQSVGPRPEVAAGRGWVGAGQSRESGARWALARGESSGFGRASVVSGENPAWRQRQRWAGGEVSAR